jgi:hypothetical protein
MVVAVESLFLLQRPPPKPLPQFGKEYTCVGQNPGASTGPPFLIDDSPALDFIHQTSYLLLLLLLDQPDRMIVQFALYPSTCRARQRVRLIQPELERARSVHFRPCRTPFQQQRVLARKTKPSSSSVVAEPRPVRHVHDVCPQNLCAILVSIRGGGNETRSGGGPIGCPVPIARAVRNKWRLEKRPS